MTTQDDIAAQMAQPRRIRGDQGEVENRSIDEMIKFDNWDQTRGKCRHTILANSFVRVSRYNQTSCG